MASPASSPSKSVLLVDDCAWYREELAEALQRRGYIVFQASNGFGALTLLEELPEGSVRLVVADYRLGPGQGVGHDGKELLEEIANRWPNVRRCLLTAYALAADVAVSPFRILNKGFSTWIILEAIERLQG